MLALGLLLVLDAHAQGLVPAFTGEHTWKLEAYMQELGVPASTNLKVAANEAWGAKITCKPIAKRVDSCVFDGGKLYWGWTEPTPGAELKLFPVETPVTLELTWSPTGRLVAWDTQGDKMTLYQNLATAFLDRHSGGWRADSPNFRRELGRELEQRAMTYLLAGLDVELPKKGDGKLPWNYGALPGPFKRGQGGLGNSKVELAVDTEKPGPEGTTAIKVQGSGTVTYNAAAGSGGNSDKEGLWLPISSAGEQTFTTKMIGRVLIDDTDGRIAATDLWTTSGSTLPVFGFKTLNFKATKWSDDLKPEPGPVPKIPWR
jgi:hypothetical protein